MKIHRSRVKLISRQINHFRVIGVCRCWASELTWWLNGFTSKGSYSIRRLHNPLVFNTRNTEIYLDFKLIPKPFLLRIWKWIVKEISGWLAIRSFLYNLTFLPSTLIIFEVYPLTLFPLDSLEIKSSLNIFSKILKGVIIFAILLFIPFNSCISKVKNSQCVLA